MKVKTKYNNIMYQNRDSNGSNNRREGLVCFEKQPILTIVSHSYLEFNTF